MSGKISINSVVLRAIRTSRSNGGFTLVEILVVVVILGLASAMIIPQIGSRDDLKVAAAARMVIADISYAQNRAIATQSMQYVTFDVAATPQTYALYKSTTAGDYVTDPVNKGSFIRTLGTGGTPGLTDIVIDAGAVSIDGQTKLAFDSLGQPYSVTGNAATVMVAGTIRLTAGSQSLTITIEPYTGEMSVQ